jgi:hypothetical protein
MLASSCWCLLLVLAVSFSYPSLLKSWSIFLCVSSYVVSLLLALETSDSIEVLLHATLFVYFVVSFWTFGWVMSYFLVFETQNLDVVLCILISIWRLLWLFYRWEYSGLGFRIGLDLSIDENWQRGPKEDSYLTQQIVCKMNSLDLLCTQYLTSIHHIKQTSSNTHGNVRSSTSQYDHNVYHRHLL